MPRTPRRYTLDRVSRADARDALVGMVRDADDAETEYGYIGVLNAAQTEYEFFIAEKPGFIKCRIEHGREFEYTECILRVSMNPYIRCMFKRIDGILEAREFVGSDAVRVLGNQAPGADVPSVPIPGFGGAFPPPVFGTSTTKILDAGVVTVSDPMERYLLIQSESSTTDDCIEVSGLSVGDEAWLFAVSGHTITLKHDDAGATDKFIFPDAQDIVITFTEGLRVFKKAAGVIVHSAVTGRLAYSTADVTAPPTDAELTSAFGTPADVGAGFSAIANDNGAGTDEYLCWSDGVNWFYATGTKAT